MPTCSVLGNGKGKRKILFAWLGHAITDELVLADKVPRIKMFFYTFLFHSKRKYMHLYII